MAINPMTDAEGRVADAESRVMLVLQILSKPVKLLALPTSVRKVS